ncbi:MAG TPA: hypothetical protein VEV83_00880 [Parafilimonas sp.]|nr:hypothetical protein [Parafilimonas sp.]
MGHIIENDSKALQKLNINLPLQSGPNHLHGSPVYFEIKMGRNTSMRGVRDGSSSNFQNNSQKATGIVWASHPTAATHWM